MKRPFFVCLILFAFTVGVGLSPEAKNLTLENAVIKSVVPYHPGAVKDFKEKGAKM